MSDKSDVAHAEQHDEAGEHGHHEPVEAEQDRPPNMAILVTVIGLLIGLVVVVIGVFEYFRAQVGSEISSKVLEHQSTALRDLRAMEESRLTRYQWVSQKDGVVRVPLPRAVELTLKDYREGAARPGETAPTAAAAAPGGPEAPAAGESTKDGQPGEDRAQDANSGKDADKKGDKAEDKKGDEKKPEKPEVKKEGEKKAPARSPQSPGPKAPAPSGEVY